MTGQQFLNILCGSSTVHGLVDKNSLDTKYRASMLGWLNLVLKDIQNRQQNWHWRWLEKTATASTVADQIDYDLPTIAGGCTFDIDTNKIFAIYDRTKDRTYKYIPYERFVRLIADPSNNKGDTIFWTFWVSMIKLWPIPSSIWTIYIDCVALATAWTDAANSNEVPTKYDSVIMDGALVYAYKFDPELGLWKTQQQIYEAGIQRMIADNNMMINDGGETESHRSKLVRYGADNGKEGMYPLST